MQLPAPAKQLARLYSSLASDRRRNCTRLHRGCNDALLLGSRPPPALPNRSHYLGLRLGHWIAPNIHYLNLSITGANFCMSRQRLNVSIVFETRRPSALPITGRWSPPRSPRHRAFTRVRGNHSSPEAAAKPLFLLCTCSVSAKISLEDTRPLSTSLMVIMMIQKSSNNDALRTYQSSNCSFCSLVTSLAPLTCAHPLIPGRTDILIDVFSG